MLPGDDEARKLACLSVLRLGDVKVTAEEVAANYSMDQTVVEELFERLERDGMIQSNSDVYELTDCGWHVTAVSISAD